jgi:hypothetical protein
MKKTMFALLAAAGCLGFAGTAMATDSPVAYVGSDAGGSAYGNAFSSENLNANGGVRGSYEVTSFASQNVKDYNNNPCVGYNDLMSIADGRGSKLNSCDSAGTVTASSGNFSGKIGADSGMVSGFTGGESLATVANIGTTTTVASAQHQSTATMATSGAGSTGMAVNSGFAVSHYSDLGNGSAITAAY